MGEFARISCTMPGLFFTISLLTAFRGGRSKPSGDGERGLGGARSPGLGGVRGMDACGSPRGDPPTEVVGGDRTRAPCRHHGMEHALARGSERPPATRVVGGLSDIGG